MKPFFSICIPTYNRGKIVYDTVCNALQSDRDDIEVVVSNNCSTDDTEELLMTITDSRFKYFKNNYNNGADNLISVLTYAQGDYLLLLSDEDDVALRNLETYIQQLHRFQPAVAHGTAAVNRYRYASMGDRYIEDCYEALKVLGFGITYMSGFIYNRRIMKKVLGDIYGTDINRRLGYGYNFLNLARRMLQYGSLMTKSELITTQRVCGKRDMGTHFDGGMCTYSPEYKLTVFYDVINDLTHINLAPKQKYMLMELYKDEVVIENSIGDYMATYTRKAEFDLKREREHRIADYYRSNIENVVGIKFYMRLYRNLIKCNNYVDELGIFDSKYRVVKCKYLAETIKIFRKRYLMLRNFTLKKYMMEG